MTYLQRRPEIDARRIGAWGTSLSAGHVFVLGAIDRRVRVVVGQMPFTSGSRTVYDVIRGDMRQAAHEGFAEERVARASGASPVYIPIAAENPLEHSALPTPDSYQYFLGPNGVAARDAQFDNRITSRSLELCFGYEPGLYLPRLSPTPVLMIVAMRDQLTAPALALAAYESALEPKRLLTVDCGHFDAYAGHWAELVTSASTEFFLEHLKS